MSINFGNIALSYFILFALSLAGGLLIEYLFQGLQVFKTKTIGNKNKYICKCRRMKPIIKNIALPSLLGMMIFPLVAYNLHKDVFDDGFDSQANSLIRQGTFGLVLFKAGLGLDLKQIKQFASTLTMLIIIPSLAQAVIGLLFSVILFDMPVTLGLGFGYLLTGTSTSIIIPLCNNFQQQGIGTDKQIPSLLILGSTIEAILALIIIQFMVSIKYSGDNKIFGDSSGAAAGLGFFEVFTAIIIGVIVALMFKLMFQNCRKMHYDVKQITNNHQDQSQISPQDRRELQNQKLKPQPSDIVQYILMLSTCITALFTPTILWQMGNFGYIFTVVMTSCLRLFWKDDVKQHKIQLYNHITGQLWRFGKYWLYGLIGTTIDVSNLDKSTAGYLVMILIIGMIVKIPVTILALSCKSKFSPKERVAISFIWIAKATVQVALGGLVKQREENLPTQQQKYGQKFATMSVLAILFCASFGAAFGNIFGRKWFNSQATCNSISPQELRR